MRCKIRGCQNPLYNKDYCFGHYIDKQTERINISNRYARPNYKQEYRRLYILNEKAEAYILELEAIIRNLKERLDDN